MGYFDDFNLLNVTDVRMYGSGEVRNICTSCHYIGIIRGSYLVSGERENRPSVYLTPSGIETPGGWYSPAGEYRDNLYIECSGPRADRFMAAFDAVDSPRLFPVADVDELTGRLLEMQRLFAAGALLHRRRITLCFEEFAALLDRELHRLTYPQTNRFNLEKLLQEISRDPGKKWDFRACAAEAGITLRHWNRLFSAAAGMPPVRFVNACRIKLARELLSSTDCQIKEIAGRCGMDNVSDFSRFFRKNCGIPPGQYRKKRVL